MLRISKLADYATLILCQLAKEANKLASASLLANELHLSPSVVSKILKLLSQAGLVTSVRGAEGGYLLAKKAQDVSLAEVVAAIEGKFAMTECCSESGSCILDASCSTKNNWKTINAVIYTTLKKFSVSDMMGTVIDGK